MQTLNEFYYSWGPSIADINRDGVQDIVAVPGRPGDQPPEMEEGMMNYAPLDRWQSRQWQL